MAEHLTEDDLVRVERPRSKHHGIVGRVTAISLDQFRTTPDQFYYFVTFRQDHTLTVLINVPYEYLLVWRDNRWVKPEPLQGLEAYDSDPRT